MAGRFQSWPMNAKCRMVFIDPEQKDLIPWSTWVQRFMPRSIRIEPKKTVL